MPILHEAYRLLLEQGLDASRVTRFRLGGYFTIVELDDGSIGACASYYRLGPRELERTGRALAQILEEDPLLARLLFESGHDDRIVMALRAALTSALSAAALRSGGDERFSAAVTPPFPLLAGAESAVVVGFGGLMESLAKTPSVRRLHVADLSYPERREEMDRVLVRYREARPELRLSISAGGDTADRLQDADTVCVTGSALCNGTMEPLLASASGCRRVVVQGQSAAIHPAPLFERGAHAVVTTLKPPDLIETADAGRLRDVLEGGLPEIYLSPARAPAAARCNDGAWFRPRTSLWRANGYSVAPVEIYRALLAAIERPGPILELGCGNGLMLRYLCDHSPHRLEPFGMDVRPDVIERARETVFPDRREAFVVGDVRAAGFDRRFATIVANPLYADRGYYEQRDGLITRLHADGSIARFVRRCFDMLEPGGRLVLFCYPGQMREIAPWREAFMQEIGAVPFRRREGASRAVELFVADRAGTPPRGPRPAERTRRPRRARRPTGRRRARPSSR